MPIRRRCAPTSISTSLSRSDGPRGRQALARQLNWEPPNHDDMPGSIPDHAWDRWRRFAELAAREIAWRAVDATAWRAAHGESWVPQFEAESAGENLLLVQHDWHGFPDPPERALHMIDAEAKAARCLGCFDYWPVNWRRADN